MRWNSSMVAAPGAAPPAGCGAARALYHGFAAVRGSVEGFWRGGRGLRHYRLLFLGFGSLGRLFFWRCGFGRRFALWLGGSLRRRWWRRRRVCEILLLLAQRYQIGFKFLLLSVV